MVWNEKDFPMFRLSSVFVLASVVTVASLTLARPASAQFRLTGLTVYNATSNGTANGGFWNSVGGDFPFNVYLFTGTTTAPTFLTSGDTLASVAPNVTLATGTNTLNFVTATSPAEYFGLNFYFNDNNNTNRITAVVRNTGSGGGFAQVASGVSTYGLPNNSNVSSANSLSFTTGGQTVTLTGLTIATGSADLAQAYNNAPGGGGDNVGTMTLTVSGIVSAPEPGALALVGMGLLPLGLVAVRRRAK